MLLKNIKKYLIWLIPNKIFIKIQYFQKFWKYLDFKYPQTFNEKIQYFKLYQTASIYSDLADKYKVRDYVKNKIWDIILPRLYWYWESSESIPYDKLPESFVIKCNHGCWYNILVKNKNYIDIEKINNQLDMRMKDDFWKFGRELQYKNISKKIIIEEMLNDKKFTTPVDYKFFCFNWIPKFIQVDLGRYEEHRRFIYDMNWKFLHIWMKLPIDRWGIEKPKRLRSMTLYAKELSKSFRFVRVDLYCVNNKVFFGEMSFTPANWFTVFLPNHEKLDKELGKLIVL